MLLRHFRAFMASRGGATSPFGKLDDSMDAFRVESSVKEAFARKAAAMTPQMGSAELLRICMRIVAFGPDQVKKMQDEQVDAVARMLGGMSGRSDQ